MPMARQILRQIVQGKLRKSSLQAVVEAADKVDIRELLGQIVQQKFEQRRPSADINDDFVRFLSGEQQSLMEISYTKEQQKQKQKQQNKNQDSDNMAVFDRKNQLTVIDEVIGNYFEYSLLVFFLRSVNPIVR